MYILEQIINGLCQGVIYALMAIGYSLIVGVTGLVTFAYGEVAMIGAFAAFYSFMFFGTNLVVALLFGFFAAALIGVFIHKIAYERFLDAPRYISLICTIAASMIIRNLSQLAFGAETQRMPSVFRQFIDIGTIRISYLQIFILGIVVLLSITLSIFFVKTKAGMALRSVSQDRRAAALVGINVKTTTLIGNCIGCGLGGIAGVLLALYYANVSPIMGGAVGLKAFSSAVLGGFSNIAGAAGGGVILGICENLGITFMSSGLRDVIAFTFLIIILLVKPQGLFGRKGGVKL